MRKPSRRIDLRVILANLAVVLCLCASASAWKEQMHKSMLTPMALDLVKLRHSGSYPREIWETYRAYIEQGAWDEDFPCGLSGVRANNHYYHAITGKGLTDAPWLGLRDPDVDTLTWALSNAKFTPGEEFNGGADWALRSWGWTPADVDFGDMSWTKAVERYGYTEDSKRLAFYTLGFICHLLEDMGDPEHVHDDPHGASGYTGFELWVWKEWDRLKPPVLGALEPRKFETLEAFFKNLARLGYSTDRFKGGELVRGSPDLARSDLGKMFKIRYDKTWKEWLLGNPKGKRILGLSSPGGGTNFLNWAFEWNLNDYRGSPLWTKGHDQGEWWPTSVEIPGSKYNDEPGYYYIELSGDMPGEPFNAAADPGRNLYPAAYLPSPLPDVAGEAQDWRAASAGGAHLYSLIGGRVFPAVVEHTAGLIEHFYDIVNPPPFVRSLEIAQPSGHKYTFLWQDKKDPPPASRTVADIGGRTLLVEFESPTGGFSEAFGLRPGDASMRITFSEPVRSVDVQMGGATVFGFLDESETVWTAEIAIAPDGPAEETREVAIFAEDKNNHFGSEGAALDGDPSTPARRLADHPDYPWTNYERDGGTRLTFRIKRN
ncbi:MAG TPA: hypothetical protein VLJ16_02540 [Acidobacteriota bacterium]|nr:hypothetical protein [Acidobacteriota bacterium]